MNIVKQIRGEYLKLKKLPDLKLVLGLFVVFLLLMFFQKGINETSGFYNPELMSVQYLTSFNLLLLSLIGFIPSAIIGAYISGIDYKNNTNVYVIVNGGRVRSIVVKLITLLVLLLIFVIFVVLLSVAEGLIINNGDSMFFRWEVLIPQFFSSYMILLATAMIGFIGTTLVKKVYGGIVIAIGLPLLLEQLAAFITIFNKITLGQLKSSIITHSFQNVANDTQVQFSQMATQSLASSMLILFVIMCLLFLAKLLINIKRDFTS